MSQRLALALALLGMLAVTGLPQCSEPPTAKLVISTGTPGGTYIRLGEQLARILDANPGPVYGEFESIASAGTVQSLERLARGEVDLAFVAGPVVAQDPRRSEVRALLALYTDALHVVVRRSARIRGLTGLRDKRLSLGPAESGTREIAARVMGAVGIGSGEFTAVEAASFDAAADHLVRGSADAAFFMAAAPAPAVTAALADGCCELLDLREHLDLAQGALPGLRPWRIPGHVYGSEHDPVQTVESRVFHTDGSLENLRLMTDPTRRVLAVVQYDMALASYWDPALYHTSGSRTEIEFPHIGDLRRIAALHDPRTILSTL